MGSHGESILLMEEIPNNHLGCIKPWGMNYLSTGAGFLPFAGAIVWLNLWSLWHPNYTPNELATSMIEPQAGDNNMLERWMEDVRQSHTIWSHMSQICINIMQQLVYFSFIESFNIFQWFHVISFSGFLICFKKHTSQIISGGLNCVHCWKQLWWMWRPRVAQVS